MSLIIAASLPFSPAYHNVRVYDGHGALVCELTPEPGRYGVNLDVLRAHKPAWSGIIRGYAVDAWLVPCDFFVPANVAVDTMSESATGDFEIAPYGTVTARFSEQHDSLESAIADAFTLAGSEPLPVAREIGSPVYSLLMLATAEAWACVQATFGSLSMTGLPPLTAGLDELRRIDAELNDGIEHPDQPADVRLCPDDTLELITPTSGRVVRRHVVQGGHDVLEVTFPGCSQRAATELTWRALQAGLVVWTGPDMLERRFAVSEYKQLLGELYTEVPRAMES